MEEPMDMLSTKDFMYISDILMIQYTYIKKLNHYSELISDSKIQEQLEKVTRQLTKGYDTLLEVLNG